MNESQAKALGSVYFSMGYIVSSENTGGNVWLVYIKASTDAPVIVFGMDTITRYGNEDALEAGNATSTIYMVGGLAR